MNKQQYDNQRLLLAEYLLIKLVSNNVNVDKLVDAALDYGLVEVDDQDNLIRIKPEQ